MNQQESLFSETPTQLVPFTPREYQVEAETSVVKNYSSGKNRQLIVLATGGGKTYIISRVIKWALETVKKPILFVAHRDELLAQAEIQFRRTLGNEPNIEREKAEDHATTNADIVLASVQTIGRTDSKRIEKFPADHFGAVIVDEAHHALSITYLNIINRFVSSPSVLSLGVTATPFRSDKESLDQIYDVVAYRRGILELCKDKWLVPPVSYRISTKTDLAKVRTTAGDYNLKDLSGAVNNSDRNTLIVETYVKRFSDKKAILFGADLEHIRRLRDEFQSIGISAECVDGETPREERARILAQFKAGIIKIVLNFGVLTEGFDDETLPLIIQARPTQSMLLLTQIVGRALRLHEGKERAEIVEIVDMHSQKTATTAQIFGFRQDFDCEDHDFLECCLKAESLKAQMPEFNPYNCRSWSNMLALFEENKNMRLRAASMMTPMGGNMGGIDRKSAEDIYFEEPDARGNRNPNYYDSRYRFYRSDYGKLMLTHNDKTGAGRYRFIIEPSGLGSWCAKGYFKDHEADRKDRATTLFNVKSPSVHGAVKLVEQWILENNNDWDRLLWLDAPWKKAAAKEPCSEKQYELIKKLRLSSKSREHISKAEAGDMLSSYFNR